MAYRMVCAPQVIDLESERGHPHVHSENLIRNGSDLSDQGGAVRVVRNATTVGLYDMQGYYSMSMNHPHQPAHNSVPNLGVDSGFVFPSSLYNPCMSTSMNRYVSHDQSFGLPLNQVVSGSMDESTRNENVGETARGYIKRKNAAAAGSCHFINGFASSSSSSHAYQNPTHRPWDPSVESNVFPNVRPFNPAEYHSHSTWPSMEGSSITGTSGFNSMAAHPESAQHGDYTFQPSHASQCFQPASNTWVSQAANGIAEGVPQWAYINTMTSVPAGRYAHPGGTEIVNGGFHEYQNGPSTISQGPLPYFHQHTAYSMPAHNPLDHTRMPIPYQQCHNNGVLHGGINHSGNWLHLGPRTPVLFSNSERSFGPPQHPFLANPVNHRNIRIPPPLRGTIMDFSRLYEVPSVVDEHSNMRLDIDSMTYEELLALEEHIGDVITSLAKGHIVDKLKTSLYVPGASCMSDQSSESSENEACIICQEEYRDADCIGTLDCGHRYHAECVKQWLTVKNQCPICKNSFVRGQKKWLMHRNNLIRYLLPTKHSAQFCI